MPTDDLRPAQEPGVVPALRRVFARAGVEVEEWVLTDGVLDLDAPPPPGVSWSRISASSHTRGHGLSVVGRSLAFAEALGTEVCGIELVEAEDGRVLTHDATTNTNDNAAVQAVGPRSAPDAPMQHLRRVADEIGVA